MSQRTDRRTVLAAGLGGLVARRAAAEAVLRAGAARVEITPPLGTPLGGYANRFGKGAVGVHDPIWAKALVLDDGEVRLGIVCSDLVGTNPEMAARVARESGFAPDRLLVCASHTHSGPGAYGKPAFAVLTLGGYRQEVFDRLTGGMVRALREAEQALRPAALAAGEKPLPRFSRNRRGLALRDPALWVLRVEGADGRPLAALVNLTAHGTVLSEKNLEFSGDWMGFTQAFLEREVPGLVALYTNGAEGDISPNLPPGASGFDGARAHGELGGREALEVYRTLRPEPQAKLGVRNAALPLPESSGAALIGAGKETRLQTMTIGDSLLIAVPGEMTVQLGLALKEHARKQGVAHPVIVGLANDHLGYFLTRAEFRKGGYEARVSFFGEGFGEELTLALARLIGGDTAGVVESLSRPAPERDRERRERSS